MLIYPAIDLYEGQAVRLLHGDYEKKTVYNDDPRKVAEDFVRCGATHIHMVDLEGAKSGTTPHIELITHIKRDFGLFCEVGGGIRSEKVIERYLNQGIDRVILGTVAVEDPSFVRRAVGEFGDRIAVGVDIRDGKVASHGWQQDSDLDAMAFCERMASADVGTIICTDISRDGAMKGTNRELYQTLADAFCMNIIASGGVSDLDDVENLKKLGLYGAIIGKAYYTGAIDLKQAIEVAK